MQQKSSATPATLFSRNDLLLLIAPAIILGMIFAYQSFTHATLVPPAKATDGELTIEQILLPEPGVIQVKVVNGSAEAVTVPQVLVDDAYWDFTVVPSITISATEIATFTLPYPWVADEIHVITLITSRGATVEGEILASEVLATDE
jgi:hypothetical protein